MRKEIIDAVACVILAGGAMITVYTIARVAIEFPAVIVAVVCLALLTWAFCRVCDRIL